MRIVVVDGQGGKLGGQIVKTIMEKLPQVEITAIGTNSAATGYMIKMGAKKAATGENAVLVAARKADVIIGPVGIVIADALLGEVTPKMALSIAQSNALRILLPINRCENYIAGVSNLTVSDVINDAVKKISEI